MSSRYSSRHYAFILLCVTIVSQIGVATAFPTHYYNGTSNEISCAGDMQLTTCHRNCGIQRTCEELFYGENMLGHSKCASVCHPGCQCPQRSGEDTYLTVDDRCVTKFECGCVHRGVFHGVNERFFRGSLLCSCEKGKTLCNSIFGWLNDNKATEVRPDELGSAIEGDSSLSESISFEYSSFEYSNYDDQTKEESVTLQTNRENISLSVV